MVALPKPTSITAEGTDIKTITFNIEYLQKNNPKLVKDILRIYGVANNA